MKCLEKEASEDSMKVSEFSSKILTYKEHEGRAALAEVLSILSDDMFELVKLVVEQREKKMENIISTLREQTSVLSWLLGKSSP